VITQEALRNEKLSDKALRLLILMINNEENFEIRTTYFAHILGWCNETLAEYTAELIALGYVHKDKIRIPGARGGFKYKYSFPLISTNPNVTSPNVTNRELNKNKLHPEKEIPGKMDVNSLNKKENKKSASPKPFKFASDFEMLHFIGGLQEEYESKEKQVEIESTSFGAAEVLNSTVEGLISQDTPIYTMDMIEPLESELNGFYQQHAIEASNTPISTMNIIEPTENPSERLNRQVQLESEKTQSVERDGVKANNSIKHLDNRFDFNKEEKAQLYQYTIDVYKHRMNEFLSEEDFREVVGTYLNNLLNQDFQPNGKAVQSWRSYINSSVNPQIQKYKEAKAEEFKELRLRNRQAEIARQVLLEAEDIQERKRYYDAIRKSKESALQSKDNQAVKQEIDPLKIYDPINQPGTRYTMR